MSRPNRGWFERGQSFFFYLGVAYAVILALLATPPIQRHIFYSHKVRWPLFPNYDLPEAYGLAPGKTLNLKIETPDNITLGAWFILSDPYYQVHQPSLSSSAWPSNIVRDALQTHPTILFFHGNAGSRATGSRMQLYTDLTSRLRANVFAIDYRGFGESTGEPSEEGLEIDAYAAWKWVLANGAREEDVLIIGHSMGANVAAKLGRKLGLEGGKKPRGVALLSPFSDLAVLLETYPILGVPLLQPLARYPIGRKLIKRLLVEEYNTLSNMQDINVPILVAHSTNDPDIVHTHSKTLVDHLMNPYLPELNLLPIAPGVSLTPEEYEDYKTSVKQRNEARALLVKKAEIPNFGAIEEFETKNGKVVYVESNWGGHNWVPLQEGVQDQMARLFRLI